MDISDEELFEATPSCSTSVTNTSLNLSEETNNSTLNSIQEKDFSNVATKDTLVKLTHLSKKKEQTTSRNKQKRCSWKFGYIKRKKSSRSQQEFQKMKSATEATSVLSEGKDNKETQHNQSDKEESYEDQKNKQTAQSKNSLILSTHQEKEEDLYANEIYGCARTLPYKYHRKDGKISNNKTEKDTASSNNTKKDKSLIQSKLMFTTTKRLSDNLNEWKFKRKYVSSDSESDEFPLPKKRLRRLSSNEFDNEDAPVSNAGAIEANNQNKSELSFEKIEKKKTDTQINRTARIILTRLENMKDENVIKWRESKIMPSDVIASAPVEEQQLDRRKLLQTLESQNNLILSKEDEFLKTKDTFENPPLTSSSIEKCRIKSRLNKLLKKKYKLFKKPRVLMIKLETLQCSSKDGRYSTIEIDDLTKKYVTSVINSIFRYKSRGLKVYRLTQLRRKSTDEENTAEDQDTSASRRQSTNEIFNSCVTEESSTKDAQSDGNVSFEIHRKFAPIQNGGKSSSSETFENKNNLPQSRLELWRNAFIRQKKVQKKTAQLPSKTVSILRNLLKESAKRDTVSTLPPISTSSTQHNMPVESPRKLASPEKQAEVPAKPTECKDTSKPESSVSSRNLLSDANVGKITSSNDFTQSEDSTVNLQINAKEIIDIIVLDALLNSNKKVSKRLPNLHNKTINLELVANDTLKSKTSEERSIEQSSRQTGQTQIWSMCNVCGATFKNHELFLKHLANNLNKTCADANSTSSNVEVSMLEQTVVNDKYIRNLINSKPSTSQEQRSSVSVEDDSNQSAKSVVGSDVEIISSSSSSSSSKVLRSHHECLKILRTNIQTRLKTKPKNPSSTTVKLIQPNSCKICLRDFDTYAQLFQHMFNHMANDLRSIYTSFENEIASTQESSENLVFDDTEENSVEAAVEENEVAENDKNEREKRLSENMNESGAKSIIVSGEPQRDATKERNKTSNLSAAEHAVDLQKQSTTVASNAVQQDTEKEKTSTADSSTSKHQLTKSFTICKCHRPEASKDSLKTDIEIVLMCTICRMLFRRFECFEMHYAERGSAESICNKSRRQGRRSKCQVLFCVKCQQILNSIQELLQHLKMHSQLNCVSKVSFCCNVCKVIFHNFGQLFINHFQSHMKNPFFLASRLSFPRLSYVGSTISKAVDNGNDKSMEIFMHVADYMCPDCRTPFASPQAFQSHKTACLNTTATSVDPRSESDRNALNRPPSILLICGFCNKTFYSRMSFELHSLEHVQKRDMHLHYTCVSVTAVTKVYICKVCTTMWQTLSKFEMHWQTHNALKEVYVCSRCQNHYTSIDQFQMHAIVHKNINELPITCEVIYRDDDPSSKMSSQSGINGTIADNLPYTDLSLFDFSEKIVKPQELTSSLRDSLRKLLLKNQSTQEVVILSESLVSPNKALQATSSSVSQVPVQVPSSNVAAAQSKRSSNGNSRNADDDSDEELTILLSESEESMASNGIRKNAGSTPSKQQNTQDCSTSDTVSADEQSVKDAAPAASSATSGVNGNASSPARISVITPESVNASVSNSKDTSVRGTSSSSATKAPVDRATETLDDCVALTAPSDANASKREPLSKNIMSSVPKSFLRVKSLAELTNSPPLKNYLCQLCGTSFYSERELNGHISVHNAHVHLSRQGKQGDQAPLSNNARVWSAFNSLAGMSMTSTRDPVSPLTAISNQGISPSVSMHSSTAPRVVNTAQQTIGVKPLNLSKPDTNGNVSNPKETTSRELTLSNNVTATPYRSMQVTAFHSNLPAQVSHVFPTFRLKRTAQQQQNTGAVAIRPFQVTHPTPRPPPPPYPQQPPPMQHLPPQLPHTQRQQQLQQPLLLSEQQQTHLQQLLRPSQQIQQLQQQQQQQQKQQQQQQQVNNVIHYLISKKDMSYQLSDEISMNSDNIMFVAVNMMQQVSKNPDRYVCLYCPGFECGSVQEFEVHESSSKHEARSHYNFITYVPQP